MRRSIVIFALLYQFCPLRAADLTVCASGCTYSTMQAAIDAANPGDTITLPAGTTFSSAPFTLTNKPGAEWITIRSSQAHLLPEGYRPAANDARLATIAFTSSAGALISLTADPAFSSDCWRLQAVGNTVTVGYLHSESLPCEARLTDGTLYTSTAPIGTVTLLGQTSTYAGSSGEQGTGLRIGLGTDGKLHISHRSDVVEGTHFSCTNCVATGEKDTWIHYNFPASTVPIGNIGYSTAGAVTGVSSRWAFLTGPWADAIDEAGLFAGTYAAAYKGPAAGVHHYRFVGVRFGYDSTSENYYGQMFFKDSSWDYRYVPHHIEWDRCVFSQPKASKGFWRWLGIYHSEGLVIKSSQFRNTQTRAEGQGILTCGALGPVILDNVEVDGGTEGFLAGGCNAQIVAVPQITVRRSLFRKRLEQRPLLRVVRQTSTDTLALTTTDGSTRCNAGTCTAYYEDTPYTYANDSTIVIASGQSAKLYVGVSPAGVLTVGHNSGSNVTCSGDFVCLAGVASRADIAEYSILYEETAASGAWGSTYDWFVGSGSWVFIKNGFEVKMARDLLFEGNIVRNYWASGGQFFPLAFTVRNQNGQDRFARLDGLMVRRNKVYAAHSGVNLLGIDDMGWNSYGRGWVFEDNVFDVDKAAWGNSTSGGICFSINDGNVDLVLRRNTCLSTLTGFSQNTPNVLNWVQFHDNLWLWSTAGAYMTSLWGQGLSYGWMNVRKSDWTATAYGYIGPTSEYRGNLNMSTSTITGTGWNSWADSASQNFTGNQRAQSVTLADQFQSWATPLTATTDLRLKATSPYSVHCASGCDTQLATQGGTDPGADWDLLETLTDGVEEGYASLAQRWGVRVLPTAAGVTVELWSASTATLRIAAHQNMVSAVFDSSTPSNTGGRQVFTVTGLASGTEYWYTVTVDGKTVKDRFITGRSS